MIKTISAVAIAATVAAALTIALSFTDTVEASAPPSSQTSTFEQVRTTDAGCAQQNWPNLDASCLRGLKTGAAVKAVRIVTTSRG